MNECPICGREGLKVIHFGFPMHLCPDEECSCLWGFWSWVASVWWDGYFLTYTGGYWRTLWRFLKGDFGNDN